MGNNILVTGGSGFIGQYVVERLAEKGYGATLFDHSQRQGKIFLGDTRDAVAVAEAIAIHDGVIHLAGVLGTQETIQNPLPAVMTNIIGSLNVFQACRQYDKKCVYIAVGNHWMNNSYSITKTTAERFALMFNKELGTDISIVRGLNAYGPKQKSAPVRKIMPNFIIPALKGEAITIYGDGSQVMDMIYVTDLADILVQALETPFDLQNPIWSAGTGKRTTVKQIAEEVIRQVGRGTIKHLPMRPGEIENSVVIGEPDTLPPRKFVSLKQGVTNTVRYYEDLLSIH